MILPETNQPSQTGTIDQCVLIPGIKLMLCACKQTLTLLGYPMFHNKDDILLNNNST